MHLARPPMIHHCRPPCPALSAVNLQEAAYETFLRQDTSQDGILSYAELAALFPIWLADMGSKQMLHLLAHCHGCDVTKLGRFKYNDLLVNFRAIPVVWPGGQIPRGFSSKNEDGRLGAAATAVARCARLRLDGGGSGQRNVLS